ncbi:MAG: PKD domain-containing protein [Stagnimonas sp.]|nr:PKD domain-containing protein [Stagnimonas sp.]
MPAGISCPAGTVPAGAEAQETGYTGACVPARHPERLPERLAMERNTAGQRGAPEAGELRRLYQRKAELAAPSARAKVDGASSAWKPYGTGPLISNDARFPSVNDLGLVELGGRVDSLDYDAENGRLFASVGTGGVWMSTDLGDNWTSVGNGLPSQTVGAVAWTPAAGGSLLALGGEPSMGGYNFVGLGAFWSDDLGANWHFAEGVPDGIMGFKLVVDKSNPDIVYAGTSKGLYRSTDAGRSYVLVPLPVGDGCEGRSDAECLFANFVTDIVVKVPGGSTDETGGEVIVGVGYRAGQKAYPDGKLHSPGNGLYRSDTGEPGSFVELVDAYALDAALPIGFTPKERIGRIAFGAVTGPEQDHNYLYAIVSDAVLFNGGVPTLDLPEDPTGLIGIGTGLLFSSLFNGIYVSPDFGESWTRMADYTEIAANPTTGSALVAQSALGYAPGVQGYYNLWIAIDPTRQLTGIPTRLLFGLEEVWAPRITQLPLNGALQAGPDDFLVIGDYFAGSSCAGLSIPFLPACPVSNAPLPHTTTHPDQHVGLFVPDGEGGVTIVAGNDGGVYKQHVASGGEFANEDWGDGANQGFNTLLPYGLAVAKDGTVWFGLQDNGSGKVDADPETNQGAGIYMAYGGDGFFASVDPDNSNIAYSEYTNADMRVTTDGGTNWSGIAPTVTGAMFSNFFMMDPTDPKHLVTGAREIVERLEGPTGDWVQVFDAGTQPANAQNYQMSKLDVQGDAIYAGFCGVCDILNRGELGFHNALATNVGGEAPPAKGTPAGWHFAAAAGLPNRYISAIEIDPTDPETVYVGLGDYSGRQWAPPGEYYQDGNESIGSGRLFKSTDAGESFVDITGSLPDAPVSSIVLREGQLIVGGDLGAFISSDTQGSGWAVLGEGFPNVVVGQMQLQPGNPNRLFVAAYGRGIWTYDFGEVVPPPPDDNHAPVAVLTATPLTGTAPLTVRFDGSGSSDPDAGDAVSSYTFGFGDGSEPQVDQAAASTSHVYSQPGTYVANLTVKDEAGKVSATPAVVSIVVTAAPPPPPPPPSGGGTDAGSEGRFGGSLGAGLLLPLALLALRRRRGVLH